ncbi:hypothetical protein M0R04_12030 [Candidatus Dojkabacteria bacterium]|jgi:hypothetical protein|nr:hypothetical protein [Candidatus Dojkabacteria bacterium]
MEKITRSDALELEQMGRDTKKHCDVCVFTGDCNVEKIYTEKCFSFKLKALSTTLKPREEKRFGDICNNCGCEKILHNCPECGMKQPKSNCEHEWMDYPMHSSKFCRKCGINPPPLKPSWGEQKYKQALEEIGNRVGSPVTGYNDRLAITEYEIMTKDISKICKQALLGQGEK